MFQRERMTSERFDLIKSKLSKSEEIGRRLLNGKRLRCAPVFVTVSDSSEDFFFPIAPVEIKSEQFYYCMLIDSCVFELCLESIFVNKLKLVDSNTLLTAEIELKIKQAICVELNINDSNPNIFSIEKRKS